MFRKRGRIPTKREIIQMSELGNQISVLKNQQLGLSIGVLLSLLACYIVLAVIVYKPRRQPTQRVQQTTLNIQEDQKRNKIVDDDYFVTIPNLLQFARERKLNGKDVMFGHKQCNPQNPVRSKSSRYRKWYISEEEYQPPILPPFLSGGSVLTQINVVRKLRIAFPYMKPIFLDDVYVSLVAQKLGIKILHDDRFVNSNLRRMDFNFIISCHNYNSTEYLYEAWLQFKKFYKLPCQK
ncbi:unnamed protein product [Mytilus edulis]|uniref:Hexosyltransferase n=1 Tax=Mytilus edulis TaxID=6550 RepID=A0A8S3RN69_MYTED|nr:unnamed protein product [Mytilus edulis]